MTYDLTNLAHAAQAVRDGNAQVLELRAELSSAEFAGKAHQERVQQIGQQLRDAQYELGHAQRVLEKLVLGGDPPASVGGFT